MKKTLKNTIFALIVIALFFTFMEGGARLIQWSKKGQLESVGSKTLAFDVEDLNPYVFFGSLPSLELRPNPDYFDDYYFEFAGKKVMTNKAPGEYRIFIMGGSVARGYGASVEEKKFYHILEQLLNENRPENIKRNFNVVSAGRLGYVSGQELVFLLMGVIDFHPDLVIHLNGFNDILAFTQYKEPPGYPIYFQSIKKALKAIKIGRTLDNAFDSSAFLSAMEEMMKKYKPLPDLFPIINIARQYERNMRHIAQLLRANHIESYLLLQPNVYFKKDKSPFEAQHIKNTGTRRPILLPTYPKLAESLARVSDTEKVKWRDFRYIFDKTPKTVFNDTVHLNDLGQKILAHALWKEIKPTVYKEN